MGHTLVTHFTEESSGAIMRILHQANAGNACKIPFGRDCDRKEADLILPHHITVFHWTKKDDPKYLPLFNNYHFPGICHVNAVRASLVYAEENSLLLMLEIQPEADFAKMCSQMEESLGIRISHGLHITLAVSKDRDEIRRIHEELLKQNVFPLSLTADGLDLYHIWRPVRKVKSFRR